MKALKNPIVAVFLAILVVVSSTLISADIRLTRECREVSDGFFDGVMVNGTLQPAISANLEELCFSADALAAVADRYEVNGEELRLSSSALRAKLNQTKADIPGLRSLYMALRDELDLLEDLLSRADLSEGDASAVGQNREKIRTAIAAIDASGYNDSVRQFRRRVQGFPVTLCEKLGVVRLPETF